MCFTPTVSLLTALFEFGVATFILFYYKKSSISKSIIIFIYLLGLYQLTEFLLCVTSNSYWSKVGFITYSFLPALALRFWLDYSKQHNTPKKDHKSAYTKTHLNKYKNTLTHTNKNTLTNTLIFGIPFLYSLFALFNANFIVKSGCDKFFITVEYIFYSSQDLILSKNLIFGIIYIIYYFGFIGYVSYLIIKHYFQIRNKIKKAIDLNLLIGIFMSLFPAIVLLYIFPSLALQFPSIYCQFAVLFAVITLIIFHLDSKDTIKYGGK